MYPHYNIKYYGQFDSFKDDTSMTFDVQIWKKDHPFGDTTEILLSGTPVIHEWQDDERNKPIKGSTLKIGIVNNGVVSLESFYSNYDDEYQVILRQRSTDAIIFIGYIVQDDCSEVLSDFNHEISITATDMLGTLKDINLLDASLQYGTLTYFSNISFSALDSISLYTTDTRVANLKQNQIIYIDAGIYTGQYTLIDITYNSITGYRLLFNNPGFTPFTSGLCDCNWRVQNDLTILTPLSEILRICLQATKIDLNTKVISTIFPADSTITRWLDGTYILPTTFSKNGEWMSCYDVIEKILDRFRATLFQSKGVWWIIRFNEIFCGIQSTDSRYYGYSYTVEMIYDDVIDTNDYFYTFDYNQLEFGAVKSIERPIGYTIDSFNYEQPNELLKNSNLKSLGALLSMTTTGSGSSLITDYEYQNDFWYPWDDNPSPTPDVRIRVKKDYLGNEIERYITIDGSTYTDYRAKMSNGIQLQKGDIITWSFQFRTEVSQPGPINLYFSARLRNCIDPDLWMDQNGLFGTSNIQYSITTGDNLNEWHDVTVTSVALPIDGIMNVFLNIPSVKANYKDLRFDIKRAQNNLGIVNGHSHKYLNNIQINNVLEKEIYIDNSPSAAISGTLFKDTYTGCIADLAKEWSFLGILHLFDNLGKLITFEEMYLRSQARYKYEGNLLRIYAGFPSTYLFGPETTFIYNTNHSDTIRNIFGKLSIDYKNGMADCSMYYYGTYNGDFQNIIDSYVYQFNYLYENN